MTVKKTLSLKRPMPKAASAGGDASEPSAPAAPATTGGATIADRFKLDAPAQTKSAGAGVGTKIAVVAGLVALAVVGILAYTLYGHWEFLKGA